MNQNMLPITTKDVEARMLKLRGKFVLIDRDVATLYGVETKRVIEAVRNNPDKFPPGYCFSLQKAEAQQLVENFDRFKTMKHSISNHAFTERGLYMLATVVGNNLSTASTETEIELNFAVVKIKHKFIRKDDDK